MREISSSHTLKDVSIYMYCKLIRELNDTQVFRPFLVPLFPRLTTCVLHQNQISPNASQSAASEDSSILLLPGNSKNSIICFWRVSCFAADWYCRLEIENGWLCWGWGLVWSMVWVLLPCMHACRGLLLLWLGLLVLRLGKIKAAPGMCLCTTCLWGTQNRSNKAYELKC